MSEDIKQIFILSGQSNMAGRGGVIYDSHHHKKHWDGVVPPECHPHPSILRLNAHLHWEQARDPLHADIDHKKTCGVGPGMAFANTVRERVGGTMGLVPCAVGGTAIKEWARGEHLYESMIKRVKFAVEGGVWEVKALLWYQGESDCHECDVEVYKEKMEKLISDVREDLSLPLLPFIQRDVIQSLFSKNKTGFITGEVAAPPKTDKKYNQWVRVDLLVLRWILNSLEKTLRENLQYSTSSKALWSEIVERYGQLNSLELYDLKKDLSNVSQDNSSLIEYYSKLKCLWETVDNLDPVPQCTCGIMSKCSCQLLKRLLDREAHSKLIQLLMGLNAGYEHVQTTLLSMEPLPPINKALGLLQKIEKQKHINDSAGDVLTASTAYVSKKRHTFSGPDSQNHMKRQKEDGSDEGYKYCTHCGRDGHVIEDCYKLKTCTFCQIKGHIQEHCYKYKASLAKKGKGKVSGKNSNVYTRPSANNVDMVPNTDQDSLYEPATPMPEFPLVSDPQSSQNAVNSLQSQMSSDVIQGIINSVTQSVLLAISDSSATNNTSASALKSSVNFAGPFQ